MKRPRQPLQAKTFRPASVKGNRPLKAVGANTFPAPKKRPGATANVREDLLEAVGQIIRESGIGFVSLREVARRAKVSHAAPAHYFKNKSGLFTAFAAQGYERMAKVVLETMRNGASDGPTSLELVGTGYVRFAIDNPEHFTIMFRPASTLELDNSDFLMAREAAYGVLTTAITRCGREGYLEGIDPELAGAAAWSIVHGLAALWLSGRLPERIDEGDIDKLAHKVTKLFVDGVFRKKLRPPRAR
jgi:AcrR family transcriptional regulator